MKNIEVLELNEKIKNYSKSIKELQGAKFSYAIIKNTNKLQKECEEIVEISKPNDEFKAYDKERISLCEKYAKKDDNGNVLKKNLTENGSYEYDIDMTSENWNSEISELKLKYANTISEFDKKTEDYIKFLELESSVEFYKISVNDVPSNVSVEIMSILEPFITE